MNINELLEHFECPGMSSHLCCELLKNPPAVSFAQWMSWGQNDPCSSLEVLPAVVHSSQCEWQVIPIPGHAVDMVGFYLASEGIFFGVPSWTSERQQKQTHLTDGLRAVGDASHLFVILRWRRSNEIVEVSRNSTRR